MKFLISLFLLIALPLFGAVPAYTSFRGTGGILITSNPPTGNITIDGSAIFTSSGTNATIATSTNGVLVAVASTNINFIMGTNVVLTATNIGSTTHIGIHSVGGQSSSMILSNLIGTVGRNVTNVISLSTSNATSKPITNSYAAGVLTVFGFEAGTNMILSMNASNIVINSAGGGGPGGDSGAIQFNQDDTFAGTNRLNYDRTNEILYVAGSVGIGTASPTYTLDVQAAIGSQRIVSTTAANETWLTFINNGAALIGLESGVPGTIVAGSSAYSFLLASQYAYPVQLATDNSVRMTILPTSGNVGINTVSPTNRLDVQGHTSLSSNLFLPNLPTNGSPIAVLAVDAAGKVYETAVPAGGGGSTVAPPISSVQFNSNGVQQGSANFTFTNNQVYINNPGAVGSAQLRLENTTQAAAWDLVIDSNPETYFLGIRNGTSYTTVWEPGGNVGIGTTNPANRLDVEGRMAIGAAYSGTSIAPTDGLIVVGNTSIGTNTPGAQLHVRPATSGGNYFRIDDTNGTPRFQFRVYPTAPHIAGLWMGDVTPANYAMLSDGTNTEVNGASSVLLEVAGFAMATVVSNGVGINTTPTNMFDVNGHTSLRSNLFLPNLPTNGSPIAFLATDAAGAVYETAVPTGGGGSATPAPPLSSVQYNSNGVMQGSTGMLFTNGNFISSNIWDISNVKYWGATGDGTTDDMSAFTNCIAHSTYITIPAGTYNLSSFTTPNGRTFIGIGKPTLKAAISQTMFKGASGPVLNLRLNGFRVIGSLVADYTSIDTMTNVHGVLAGYGLNVSGVEISGFAGAAIYVTNNASSSEGRMELARISGCWLKSNYCGIWLDGASTADYLKIDECAIAWSRVAAHVEPGNIVFDSCHLTDNFTGLEVVASGNDGHGTITSSLLNHNTYPLIFSGITNGFVVSDCQIFTGIIRITNSLGVMIGSSEITSSVLLGGGPSSGENILANNWGVSGKISINKSYVATPSGFITLLEVGNSYRGAPIIDQGWTFKQSTPSAGLNLLGAGVNNQLQLNNDESEWRIISSNDTTGAAQPISVFINNTKRLTLLTNGNFGVGSTGPVARFQVNGSSWFTTADFVFPTTGSILEFNNSAASGNTFGYLQQYTAGGGAFGNLVLEPLGGKIGVGTNTPLATLDVVGGIRSHTVTASRMAAFHTDKTLTNSRTSSDLLQMFFDIGISNIVAADANIVIRTNAGSLTISNSMASGGAAFSGHSNAIPFINGAGTALTYLDTGFLSLTNPGFGFNPIAGTGPQGGYGGLLVFANISHGLVTIGHPNTSSDFATLATAFAVSNRYNGTGFKQEMSKYDAVDVGSGSDPTSTFVTYRTWSGTTPTIAAEIRKDGMGFFSHGTMYPSNSLASTMPTAAELGPGGIWVGNSNASLVAIKSANGTTTAMTVLVP